MLSYRRAEIAGFWTVVSTAIAIVATLGATSLSLPEPWAWGTLTAALVVAPGLRRDGWFEAGIWVWNGSTRRVAAVLRQYVAWVAYYVLFVAVARAGSSLDLAASEARRSGWTARRPHETDFQTAWGGSQPAWDRSAAAVDRQKSGWTLALIPVLLLLALLGDEQQDTAPPTSTYTLY